MSAGPESDAFGGIIHIRLARIVFPFKPANIDQHLARGGLPRQRRDAFELRCLRWHRASLSPYGTGQGLACQISVAYSAMVRSLENLPELAKFAITLPVQPSSLA